MLDRQIKRFLEQASAAFAALGLGITLAIVSILAPNASLASAITVKGGQVQSRALFISSSAPSATGVTYTATFKPATTATIKGIILDFCQQSPIPGDSNCSLPDTGAGTPTFTLGSATPTVTETSLTTPITTTALPGTWTATGMNAVGGKYRTLKLIWATGSSLTAGTTYSFNITGMTNPANYGSPAVPHSFYARILTYTSNTGDIATYAPGNESQSGAGTDLQDFGGFALSTANTITVTAKVQETLSFCVINVDPSTGSNTCSNATFVSTNLPNLTLGHGTPPAIDSSAVDTSTAYMQLSTNASLGAGVRLNAINTCSNAGLSTDGGATCTNIPGIGSLNGNVAATAMTVGTAAFGLYVGNSYLTTGVTTSTGTITPSTVYHSSLHVTEGASTPDLWYGMDNTAGSGVTGTFGSLIASSTGPVSAVNNHLVFAATAALTTPAGTYAGSESLVATGTF